MQEQFYRAWLTEQGKAEKTINSRISNARRIEEHYGDLDNSFVQDGLESLIDLFKYSAEDTRNGRPNPTTLPINGELRTNLAMYKNALGLYQSFRQETSAGFTADTSTIKPFQPVSSEAKPSNSDRISERYMQVLLRRDITQLEAGLEIIDDGAERRVGCGNIDIMAKDSSGSFVVIELKIGKAGKEAIGQVLGYMGDIKAEEGDTAVVRGILVADDFDKKAIAAVRLMPALVSLKKYTISFSISAGV